MSSPRSSLDLTPKPLRRKSRLSIHALLEQTLHIRTNDGRVFIGTFICTDKPLNIILVNTEEYRFPIPEPISSVSSIPSARDSDVGSQAEPFQTQRRRYPPPPTLNPNKLPKGRYVGMVLIPFRLILSIHSQVSLPLVPTLNPLRRRSQDQLGQRDGARTRETVPSTISEDVDEDEFELVSEELDDVELDDDIRDSIYI